MRAVCLAIAGSNQQGISWRCPPAATSMAPGRGNHPQHQLPQWDMAWTTTGGAFGGNRGVRPVPPEKGVFPLDHLHECDLEKKDYLACLKSTGFQSEKCRQFSKKYLECRMERLVCLCLAQNKVHFALKYC
nr:unnamed protein product [Digitaria exilis]